VTQVGYLSPEDMRLVWAVCNYLKTSGFVIPAGRYNRQQIPPPTPVFVRNDTGVEIPAFACLQSTGTVEAGGQNYVKVDYPADTTGTAGVYLFNGIAPIEIDGYGIAHDGPECRMLTDGSTITSGAKWQAQVGSFELAPGGTAFSAIGADDIAADVMRGVIGAGGGAAIVAITKVGGIAARATSGVPHTFPSATVDLLDPVTGDYYSPNRTATVYNSTSITIDAAHVIQAKLIGSRYFVDVDDCS